MSSRLRPSLVHDRIVIVGTGPAGLAAAEELRRLGFGGGLAILGDEIHPPYDRTACTGDLLTGRRRPTDVLLPVSDSADARWYLGRRAVELDRAARTVFTDTGEAFDYDGLVIATGISARLPPNWPYGERGLHVLHGLDDAVALRRDLRHAERVIVVGGGLTGCEIAYAVRSLGRDCVLVDGHSEVLSGVIGEQAGWLVTQELRHDGIGLRLGRRFLGVARLRGGWRVYLDDGDALDADLVVSAMGARPDTSWLEDSGLDTSDGVLCDETLRVVGADDVVAAGAVARWPNLRYRREPMRCSHWITALEQGRAAARTLLAAIPVGPVALVPRFWSEQGDLRIQACGWWPPHARGEIDVRHPRRHDTARSGVVIRYDQDDESAGLVAINAPHAFAQAMGTDVAVAASLP